MAVEFNGASTVVNGATPNVSVPTYQAGDLLILISITGATDFSTPSGWTRATTGFSTGDIVSFYKFAGASESSVTLTGGGASSRTVMLSYSYVDDFDQASAKSSTTGTSASSPTLTVNNNDEIILHCYGIASGSAIGISPPSNTNLRVQVASTSTLSGLVVCDEIFTGTGTTTARLAACGSSATWFIRTIAFTANRGYFFGAM